MRLRVYKRYLLRKCVFGWLIVLAWISIAQYYINLYMQTTTVKVVHKGTAEPRRRTNLSIGRTFDGIDVENITVCGCYDILLSSMHLDRNHQGLTSFSYYEEYKPPIKLSDLMPLSCIPMVDIIEKNKDKMDKHCFKTELSHAKRIRFVYAVKKVLIALEQKGVWISLIAGSLLGSVRIHGFLPWDNDMDFAVLERERSIVVSVLKDLAQLPEFNYYDPKDNLESIGVLCEEPDKHNCLTLSIWSISLDQEDGKVTVHDKEYEIDTFVPLRKRPFEGVWFPAPNKPMEYLRELYGEYFYNECVYTFHHKVHNKSIQCKKLYCAKLKSQYAHAEFCAYRHGYMTEIKVHKRLLHAMLIRPSEY